MNRIQLIINDARFHKKHIVIPEGIYELDESLDFGDLYKTDIYQTGPVEFHFYMPVSSNPDLLAYQKLLCLLDFVDSQFVNMHGWWTIKLMAGFAGCAVLMGRSKRTADGSGNNLHGIIAETGTFGFSTFVVGGAEHGGFHHCRGRNQNGGGAAAIVPNFWNHFTKGPHVLSPFRAVGGVDRIDPIQSNYHPLSQRLFRMNNCGWSVTNSEWGVCIGGGTGGVHVGSRCNCSVTNGYAAYVLGEFSSSDVRKIRIGGMTDDHGFKYGVLLRSPAIDCSFDNFETARDWAEDWKDRPDDITRQRLNVVMNKGIYEPWK